jgi:flagellar motor component MotA
METITQYLNYATALFLIGIVIFSFVNTYLAIKLFLIKRSNKKLRHRELMVFYDMIKNNHKELRPFLLTLNRLVDESIDWSVISLEELNKIMDNYKFYKNTFRLIIENKFVSDENIIRFASLHAFYVKFSRKYQKIKNLQPVKFKDFDWVCLN